MGEELVFFLERGAVCPVVPLHLANGGQHPPPNGEGYQHGYEAERDHLHGEGGDAGDVPAPQRVLVKERAAHPGSVENIPCIDVTDVMFDDEVRFRHAVEVRKVKVAERGVVVSICNDTPSVDVIDGGSLDELRGRAFGGRFIEVDAYEAPFPCQVMDLRPHTVAVCGNNQSGTTDGSGIRAALWVGADMDTNPTSMYFDRSGMVPSAEYTNYIEKPITENAYLLMGSQPFLHVNIDGKRFGNEAVPYDFKVNAAGREPNKCWITVWDANWKEDVERFNTIGCSRIAKPEHGMSYTSFEQIEGMHEQLLESGRLQTADTLEELAEKLCVRDVDAFIATIERYNELADLGVDEDFGKPAYRLSHIVEPPFYGAMMMGNLLCTLDGLRINADMQVLETPSLAFTPPATTRADSSRGTIPSSSSASR